jgi:hypothetical protein
LNYAFVLALGRKPLDQESTRMASFLTQQRKVYVGDPNAMKQLLVKAGAGADASPDLAAWISVGRVLFNLDDFMTRE